MCHVTLLYLCNYNHIQSCNKILSPILFLFIHNHHKLFLKGVEKIRKLFIIDIVSSHIFQNPIISQQSPHGPNKAFHIVNQHNNLLCAMMSSILVTEKGFWQPRIPLEIPSLIEAVPLPTKSWINFGNLRHICFPKKHKMSINPRISSC